MTLENVENTIIQAELRELSSKGQIKKNRTNGTIPGVLYSKGKSTVISVLESNLPKKHSQANIVTLMLNNAKKTVLMKEVQVNSLNDKPIHFDFHEVSPEDKVNTSVPLNFVGLTREQEKEGTFNVLVRYLELNCLLSKLPNKIDVDVSKMKAGESIKLFDLSLSKNSDIFVKTGKGKNVALASLVKS